MPLGYTHRPALSGTCVQGMGLLMTNRWILGATAGVLALQAQAALAAPTLDQCRALQDPQARLACYDAISAPPVLPPAPVEPAARREEQTKNFGLTEQQKAPEQRAEVEEVQATISGVRNGRSGPILELDNGQTWQVGTDGNLHQWLKTGQVVTIKRGLLSGYRLRADGVTGMEKAQRLQ